MSQYDLIRLASLLGAAVLVACGSGTPSSHPAPRANAGATAARAGRCLPGAPPTLQRTTPLDPDFPTVRGRHQITSDWALDAPAELSRRREGEDLVLWRPGFTIWIAVWQLKPGETKEARLALLRADASKEAYDVEERTGAVIGFSYRLWEPSDDASCAGFNAFVVGETSHVQLGIYFDSEPDVALARAVWQSLTPVAP